MEINHVRDNLVEILSVVLKCNENKNDILYNLILKFFKYSWAFL